MEHIQKINIVQLATELAEEALINGHPDYEALIIFDEEGNVSYTEEGQKIFDEYYDYYYNFIINSKIEE